jgi:uncharacterized cysteine cluster protein YcgN (CxxCxxCC family)
MTSKTPSNLSPKFWKKRSLNRLTKNEWEALCDGCAKCCLHRLEDEESGEVYISNIVCRYLNEEECRCSDYENRSVNVPDCVSVTPELLQDPYWLPSTCAYRLLAEGKELPDWHPLVSGTQESVETSGNSIKGRVICETEADDPEFHLVQWAK